MGPRAAFGLPEPDGGVPFCVVGARLDDGGVPLAAGRMVGGQGLLDVDGGEGPAEVVAHMFADMVARADLRELPVHEAWALLLRATAGVGAPEMVAAVWGSLPEGLRNTAQLSDPTRSMPQQPSAEALAQSAPLIAVDSEVVFGLAPHIVQEALPAILERIQQSAERADIGAVVHETADRALGRSERVAWSLALDVLAVVAMRDGDQPLCTAARHTALAIAGGAYGSELPFVRMWTERALATMAEAARAMAGPGPVGPRIAAARAGGSSGGDATS